MSFISCTTFFFTILCYTSLCNESSRHNTNTVSERENMSIDKYEINRRLLRMKKHLNIVSETSGRIQKLSELMIKKIKEDNPAAQRKIFTDFIKTLLNKGDLDRLRRYFKSKRKYKNKNGFDNNKFKQGLKAGILDYYYNLNNESKVIFKGIIKSFKNADLNTDFEVDGAKVDFKPVNQRIHLNLSNINATFSYSIETDTDDDVNTNVEQSGIKINIETVEEKKGHSNLNNDIVMLNVSATDEGDYISSLEVDGSNANLKTVDKEKGFNMSNAITALVDKDTAEDDNQYGASVESGGKGDIKPIDKRKGFKVSDVNDDSADITDAVASGDNLKYKSKLKYSDRGHKINFNNANIEKEKSAFQITLCLRNTSSYNCSNYMFNLK